MGPMSNFELKIRLSQKRHNVCDFLLGGRLLTWAEFIQDL